MSAVDAPHGLATLLDIATVAEVLGVTERFVRRLVEENRIEYHKIGKFVRFHPNDVSALIEASRVDKRSSA